MQYGRVVAFHYLVICGAVLSTLCPAYEKNALSGVSFCSQTRGF